MEDNKRKLYDALSDEFDLGTYEEFERNIGDSVKRQKLYDAASADYDLGDYESYSQKIGPTHRESLEAFTAEHGSFLNDFEARDSAEIKESRAGMSSGIYIPSKESITGQERQRYLELHKQEEALKKAWFTSDEYLAQKDADALFLSNIRKNINRESVAFAQANPALKQEGAFQANPYATRGAEADTELEKYMTASRIMDDAIKMHNAPSRYDGKNVFLKFGKGAGDVLSDADFWTAGLSEITDNFGVRSVLKNVQDKLGNLNDLSEESIENILSPAEKAVLQAWAINAQEQLKRKDDLSRAYQAGQGATESLGFMAEFALTGGVGQLASEGVESMAKWLSKKAMTTVGGMADDVAEKVLKETGEKIARSTAGKYGTRLAESLAEAAGRTGVMPSTFRNISEKATEIETDEEGNNYLVGMNNAFAKGFADSFIENLSEGGRVNALGELIGDVAGKVPAYKRMVDKFSKTKASELLDAFNSSGIMNTLRAGGWHGLGEEYLEEWYGNTLRTLTGVDKEALKEFATVDNQIVTISSFLPMTIFGGTVGTAQVLSASRDLEKKSAALKSALLERGYDEAQANNMIDMMRGSTPAEVSEFLSPIVNSVAGRSVDEAAALMKPVGEFAAAVRKWQAFDTKYRYQEQEQRDNLRAQMEETLGQFWQEDENGRQTVQRGVNASGESVYLLGKPSADEAEAGVSAEVAAITSDGRKVFVNPSEYELDDELELNEFLGTEIMAEKGNREKARMVEERDAQNAAIREAAVPGTAINIGTEEAPVQAIVIQRNPDGVIVNTPDGQTRQMTLEEFGNYVGINAVPMTDAQIEEQEAAALSAERAQREAALDQEYSNEDSAYEEIAEAEDDIEQATEAAEVLPLKADGSVDQTALWNRDPERWAAWNDEQRQDGGVNSLAYINGAIAKESARIAEMQAGYDAISDFDERDAVEREVVAVRERLQRLVDLRDGYVAQAEAAQAPVAETGQVAPRVNSQMREEEMEQFDEQYDGILRQTKSPRERARLLQEYLNALSEGSVPAIVLTKDNYAEVMESAGCSRGQILAVKRAVDRNKPVGGFMAAGQVFVMASDIYSIETARLTYIHERQHTISRESDAVERMLASGIEKETLKSYVRSLAKDDFYDQFSIDVLADEFISFAMEQAFTYEDFSVALQELGIDDNSIEIIKSIYDGQRSDQSLLKAGRRRRLHPHANVDNSRGVSENEGNIEQVSGGLLGQQDAGSLGSSGRGVSSRSTGEGAEVISDDEEAEVPTAEEVLTEAGFEADEQNEDARFSVRYLPTPEQREGIIDSIIQITGRTREEAERWLESELSLVPIVLNDKEYLDYAPDSKYKAIKDNSDYPQGTVDFNNICRKRKDFTRMYTRLQRAYPNRIFTAEDLADIRTIMSEDGLVVACGLCYVEDRRQKLGEVADEFIKDLQDGFKSYGKKNATKKANAEKFRSFVGEDTYVPSIYDLITLEGSDKLHDEHKGIWDAFGAYNRARGQQTQNTFQGYAEYKREILTWSDAKVKKVNSLGGLRIFSYSDFEAHHLLDIIQIIIDCAARGVMIQGYTKVPEFARVVEKTGIKLNRSLIPLGDTGIVHGKLAYDPVEGIDINDPNFLESNDNVGNILIGINDEQIRMAMADPFIHYIIPYHARQAGNIRAKLNVGAWTNYIDTQNERKMSDGKRVEKNINIYTDVLNESITNDREFVEKYLEVCREKGYIPKFDQFLDKDAEGNYVYTPGYYKFLVDFKLFDEAGNILPQKPVVAQFDDAFNAQVLNDYAREERETAGASMNSTYDKIVETLDLGEPIEGEDVRFRASEGPIDLVEEARKAQAKHDAIKFRFIGKKGARNLDKAEEATIRLDNLDVARQMEEAGKDAKTIRLATGWERGVDNLWRYEVPDEYDLANLEKRLQEELDNGAAKTWGIVYPSDLGQLLKEYPDFNVDIMVWVGDEFKNTGAYSPATEGDENTFGRSASIEVEAKTIADVAPLLAHEIQHAIQEMEGFAEGGQARGLSDKLSAELDKRVATINQLREEGRNEEADELIQMSKGLAEAVINNEDDAYGNYKKLAGEVEARNAAKRIGKSLQERRESLLSETEDVAREDQIILMESLGVSEMSHKADAKMDTDKVVSKLGTQTRNIEGRSEINNIIDRASALVAGTSIAEQTKQRRRREKERLELTKDLYSRILNNQFDDVTLRLIDKYIEDATPENPYGSRISQRLPQEMERSLFSGERASAVNALFSRVSEGAVSPSDRKSQSGKKKIEETKKNLLKNWAKATGMWYDSLSDVKEIADTTPFDEGTESKVYASTIDGYIIKTKKGKPYGKRFRPDIDDLSLFNYIFPDTAYHIIGYGDFGDGISTIVAQPAVVMSDEDVTTKERVDHMASIGMKPINKDKTAFSNGKIVASDIQGKNIVKDAPGNIRVIDADMKLHTTDVGGEHVIPDVETDWRIKNKAESSMPTFTSKGENTQLSARTKDASALSADKGSNNLGESNIRFRASNNNQAIFVSNAAKAVEGIKMEKATPEQWLKMIEKNGGLKAGEDKWMGLSDWLKASDKKTLTKAEVLDFINENMIIIEEQHYEEDAPDEEALWYKYEESEEGIEEINYQMQLDAENYVELALAGRDLTDEEWEEEYDRLVSDYIEDDLFGSNRSAAKDVVRERWMEEEAPKIMEGRPREINTTRLDYTTAGLTNLHEIALTVPTIESWNESDELHFGDAGEGRAVAWIRFGDTQKLLGTVEVEGKKKFNWAQVLVIDEIQSKRHQEGRDKGYSMSREEYQKKLDALETEGGERLRRRTELLRTLKEKYGEDFRSYLKLENTAYVPNESVMSPEEVQEWNATSQEEINDAIDALKKQKRAGVPDAPFDKNWHELAMKRMLRYAAENGYDVIAWTKGEQQAERYNISKQVDTIEAEDNTIENFEDGTPIAKTIHLDMNYGESIVVNVDSEGNIRGGQFAGNKLDALVGKELAIKLMSKGHQRIEGDGLKVGGEGMKGFYDKMLPAFMNKYGKKWGVKVEDINFPGLEGGLTMHSVPVTEEMKSSVMEGQVMFRINREDYDSAVSFTEAVVQKFSSKYFNTTPISILDGTKPEEALRALGLESMFTPKDIENVLAGYIEGKNIIAIFAKDRVREVEIDEDVIENAIFHECIHQMTTGKKTYDRLSKYLWDNADVLGLSEQKADIEAEYEESQWYYEMIASALADKMTAGETEEFLRSLPAVERAMTKVIFNKFGYEPGKEDIRRANANKGISRGNLRNEEGLAQIQRGSSSETRFRATEITPEVRAEMDTIAATAIVNGNYLKAPNGADTNLTPEQWAMVRTKNFVDWFGDWINDPENASKVVDENGEPRIMHHGSDWQPLSESVGDAVFNMNDGLLGKGAYFASGLMEATMYAEIATGLDTSIDGNLETLQDEYVSDYFLNIRDKKDIFEFGDNDIIAVAKSPSQIKSATDNTGEFSNEDGDIRFRTSLELDEEFGDAWRNQQNEDGRHSTQVANTKSTYEKIGRYLEEAGMKGASILDASSGLGLGTQALREMGFNVEDVEPFPSENREAPTFSSYADIDGKYDVVISNAVLNVIPDDWRADVLHQMADAVKDGGKMIINTRPASNIAQQGVEGKTRITLDSPSEILVKRGDRIAAYQKGFTSEELAEWIKSELGEGWRVEKATKKNSGISGEGTAVVIKEYDDTRFRTIGTPTEDVVAQGISLSPSQTASLAGDIFAALPEESRKKITDGLNGNILGLQDAILQIPTSLATKENWNDEDRHMAEVVAEQMTKAVGKEMTRPFSASEALWTLYNAVNKATDLVSEASRALVRRNLGFDSQTLEMEQDAKDGVRFRTVGDASANAQASMYNRGAANVWTRLKESFVDMNASVEELVKAIEKISGKTAQGFENILMALNQQSSKGLAAMEAYEQRFLNKMFDEIRKIMDKTDFRYEDIVRYAILKHGLERNTKLAQRDAKAHYQEIYDEILSLVRSLDDAQKRTYLTNAHLKRQDALAKLAALKAVDTTSMTAEEKDEHKRNLAKAYKMVEEAEQHLFGAEKVANLSEAEVQKELEDIFKSIESGKNSVYKEMRKNDYSGISSMFYDQLGVNRKDYSTEEEYQAALMQAKADKYDNLSDIEGAAQMEVTLFENAVDTDNLWKSINAATKETLRQQYEANMISKDQYDNLRNMFEFYVPLRGFKDNTAEDMYTYYRRPNSTGYTKPILGAEGRKTEAESPFGWIASMAGSAIASNVKNEAKLALYYFVSNRPDNGIATVSKTWFVHTPGDVDANGKRIFHPAYPTFDKELSTDDAKQAYEDWQEQMRELQKQGLAYEAGQRLNLGNSVVNISDTNKPEHIVTVKVGGKDYTIVINGNPRAAQAINGDLNIEATAQDYSSVFGPMLRWMSSVNTSYNPEFWITNMMRDMAFTMMAVNIKGDAAYRRKFKKNYLKAFKVISLVAKNEKGTIGDSYIEQQYKDFVKYGGVTGYTQIKDSETWEKEIENYLTSNDPDSIRSGKVMRGMKSAFHGLHRFGESLEQVSRFAAFLTARETGKSVNEAINDAKEITVNFNRKGSGKMITLEEAKYLTDRNGQPLNKVEQWMVVGLSSIAPLGRRAIMFFNAAIQGLNATYKLYAKDKTKAIGWALGYAAVGMMNAVLHAMLDDDDDYLDIPQYERRTSLMIGGNGAYFKWALPQEARAFYALGDLAVESFMGRNPHQSVIGEALKISTELLPINPSEGWKAFIPSVAVPIVELKLNEDYKGSPIYNEQKWLTEEEKKRSTRWSKAYSGTGDLYIGIAKVLNAVTGGDKHDAGWINLQPEKMEHIVQSAFGGTIRTADKFINTIMAAFDPEEDVTVRQFPFLNRFLTINDERYRNVHVNDVYDYYAAEAEHALRLQKQYTKDRDTDALKDLRSSDEYKWATVYSRYKKPIKKYQEAIRAADTTNERMELMKQQDELKRKMIKEISDL